MEPRLNLTVAGHLANGLIVPHVVPQLLQNDRDVLMKTAIQNSIFEKVFHGSIYAGRVTDCCRQMVPLVFCPEMVVSTRRTLQRNVARCLVIRLTG